MWICKLLELQAVGTGSLASSVLPIEGEGCYKILILREKRGKGAKKGCEGVVSEEEEEEYLIWYVLVVAHVTDRGLQSHMF